MQILKKFKKGKLVAVSTLRDHFKQIQESKKDYCKGTGWVLVKHKLAGSPPSSESVLR